MIKKDLIIFSNLRQIKDYIKNLKNEGFFATTISINEFLQDFAINDKRRATEVEQIIAMSRACNKTKDYKKLNFSNDFLSFLKNKEYLFSFFSELNSQKVSIDDLRNNDLYSFFDEYLDILEECLKHYKNELDNQNLYDDITIKDLKANWFLLSQYKSISFYLNGFLKQYELEFFESISDKIDVKIITNVSDYNINLLKKSFKIDFEPNHTYTLSFNNSWQILEQTKLNYNNTLKIASFKSSIYQYIYALSLISKYYENDKQIALIMPDESIATSLKALDIHNYLNIASGLNSNEIAQKLNAILGDDELALVQKRLLNTSELDFSDFDKLKEQLLSFSKNAEIKEILKNRLNDIKILNNEFKLTNEQIIKLLDANNIKISHTNGGNVDALGMLESRGMKYDLVIVIDFNDDLVPKRSVSEMFLNNAVRTKAGLISYADRENLQRHYYKELFNAKEVFVLYLENEEKSPARMLKDFSCQRQIVDEKGLIESFLKAFNGKLKANENIFEPDLELIKNHNFFAKPLSFSRLSCYLNSPYEYYLKYILELSEPSNSNEKAAVGTMVHEFLQNADFKNLKQEFEKELKDKLSPIDYALIYDNLDEIAYYINNNQPSANCEEKLSGKIANIDAYGIADRISDELIIDYKTTNKPNSTKNHEKQLAFYAMLLDKPTIQTALIYLKSTRGAVFECKNFNKLSQEIESDIATLKDGFVLEKNENAYGYYHLIINKKDRV